MLLTFLIDPPFLLFLGYLFAFALPLHAATPIIRSRALKAGLITLTIFNMAVVISYLRYPDWMWMYLFSASQWSAGARLATLAGGVLIYYILFLYGFAWGLRRRVANKPHAWWPALLLLVMSGLVIVPVFEQYFHVGTQAEYLAGHAVALPASSLAPIYNVTIPCMLIIGTALFVWARKETSR